MPLSRVQPAAYEVLLEKKVDAVSSKMAEFSAPAPHIYPSPSTGFRLRAEFRMWHEGETVNYVMFRKEEPNVPVTITDFPIAHERIQRAMHLLHRDVNASTTLRRKLYQVEFMATLSGELLITLVYHRQLDEAWEQEARQLAEALLADGVPASLIGRSRRQKLVIGRDYIEEVLPIHGKEYCYRQYEQSFSQPNGFVNIHMIEWACSQASLLQGDLLELYCGNGNFTFPLAQHFSNVIATELSKVSMRAAHANISANNIKNVHLIRLSAEEVTQAMNEVRPFRRLQQLPQPLHQYALNTLFVDPPRAGLDPQTVAMAARFQAVIYISCNPETLLENLRTLHDTHSIEQFALFDQFPYTDHMECGVLLKKRAV